MGDLSVMDDILERANALARCTLALADDAEQFPSQVQQLVWDCRAKIGSEGSVMVLSALCAAESLLLLKRPGRALTLLRSTLVANSQNE
ncbi:hypothetical protein OKW43_008157 [Paraburkholderia sp. WC7.3g]|uniref:hypothetical protein n=1 Tax=Paraburkholderia sp. WC7.3g TaxID=2991070 RepID=UPI003D243185